MHFVKNSTLILLTALMSAQANAACGGEISFAKGKSSTTITGQVAGDAICEYQFRAQKGQYLTVSMGTKDRPQAFLFSPVEKALLDNEAFELPQSGQYTLRVGMTRNDARKYSQPQAFTMTFAIDGTAKATFAAPQPAQTDSMELPLTDSKLIGRYQGTLPCNTCDGIETTLVLKADETYTLSERYFNAQNSARFSADGNWMSQGTAVILQPNHNGPSTYFIAQDNSLYAVSREQAGEAEPNVTAENRLQRTK